jgi:hypothetical protein
VRTESIYWDRPSEIQSSQEYIDDIVTDFPESLPVQLLVQSGIAIQQTTLSNNPSSCAPKSRCITTVRYVLAQKWTVAPYSGRDVAASRMPARSTPPPYSRNGFQPPNNATTFKDLLHFEERLKINATMLKKRKRKYQGERNVLPSNDAYNHRCYLAQAFLVHLVLVILVLASDVVLNTSFVMLPVNFMVPYFDNRIRIPLIMWWLDQPEATISRITTPLHPHPYIIPGLWLVSITTLVLFFASGLYSEKISYANRYVWYNLQSKSLDLVYYQRYVPQANRALRNFNLHLNVRTQPISPPAPLKYLFPRPAAATSPISPSPTHPLRKGPFRKAQLNPIPPTNNPRGELIFSNRVDRSFREAYERYRSVWERKREEHLAANRRSWFGWLWFMNNKPIPVGAPGKDRGRTTPTPGSSRTPSRRSSPAGGVRKNRTRTPELPSSPLAQVESGGRTSRPSLTTVPEAGVPDVTFPTSGRLPSFGGEEGDDSIELVRSRTESFSFLLQRQDSLDGP